MADAAEVRSIDAVREWHAALATYGESLSEALAGVELEIRRAYDWINEQGALWKRAVRDCEEDVVRAKAELAQRKFPTWDGREPDCTVQERNLRLAKARLEHAEDQVVKCREWAARLPRMIDEVYLGSARRLTDFVGDELPKALAGLARRVAALEAYAGLRPDHAPAPAGSGVVAAPPPAAAPAAGNEASPQPPAPGGAKP
jgi:hypothetical protein